MGIAVAAAVNIVLVEVTEDTTLFTFACSYLKQANRGGNNQG